MQDKQRKWAEDQRNLYQQQAQTKAQVLRYEDDLARKRMQVDIIVFFLTYSQGVWLEFPFCLCFSEALLEK